MIKAIIFDCFGVLIKSGHTLLRQDFPELIELVDELQAKSDLGVLSRQEFNQVLAEKTGLSAEQVDDRYWGTNKYDFSAIDMADNLKKSGKFKVGLLSNISRDWMSEILDYFASRQIFDEILLSGDINIVKPDPKIFTLMATKLNLEPYECVMVDDLASNVNGARIAGMHGVVFYSTNQAIEDLDNILEIENA